MVLTINDRIRVTLILMKKTQRALAGETGIPEWRISKIANNKTKVAAKEIYPIAKALRVPLECILGEVPIFDKLVMEYINSLWVG